MESVQVYGGLRAALEKLTSEAAVLAEHTKRVGEYNVTLGKMNTSFDKVQSRLVRVASVKAGFSAILVSKDVPQDGSLGHGIRRNT